MFVIVYFAPCLVRRGDPFWFNSSRTHLPNSNLQIAPQVRSPSFYNGNPLVGQRQSEAVSLLFVSYLAKQEAIFRSDGGLRHLPSTEDQTSKHMLDSTNDQQMCKMAASLDGTEALTCSVANPRSKHAHALEIYWTRISGDARCQVDDLC